MRLRAAASVVASVFALAVVYGRITDLTTGQPLTQVKVTLDRAHHAVTGQDGHYRLTGVKPGSYTLTLQSNDVPPQQASVTVRKGAAKTQADLTVCSTTLDYACHPSPG